MANYADTVCEILKEPTGVYVLVSCDVHRISHCMLCILKIITLESLNACEYTHTRERYPCTNVQATVTTADHTHTHINIRTHTHIQLVQRPRLHLLIRLEWKGSKLHNERVSDNWIVIFQDSAISVHKIAN